MSYPGVYEPAVLFQRYQIDLVETSVDSDAAVVIRDPNPNTQAKAYVINGNPLENRPRLLSIIENSQPPKKRIVGLRGRFSFKKIPSTSKNAQGAESSPDDDKWVLNAVTTSVAGVRIRTETDSNSDGDTDSEGSTCSYSSCERREREKEEAREREKEEAKVRERTNLSAKRTASKKSKQNYIWGKKKSKKRRRSRRTANHQSKAEAIIATDVNPVDEFDSLNLREYKDSHWRTTLHPTLQEVVNYNAFTIGWL